jgi:hypothetical protein
LGAPSTGSLTELIKDSAPSFLCKDGKTKVLEFIYDHLIKSGHKATEINFETIINVIEELIVHYAYFDGDEKLPSISKSFFSSLFDDILNFSIAGGEEKHGYRLEIPSGTMYPYAKSALNNESPEQFYFQHLLSVLLININARISKYSYHTETHSVITSKTELNQSFKNWYHTISKNTLVRMYTLNYDRLFKVLAEETGISVFEGFEFSEVLEEADDEKDLTDGRLNIGRILSDLDSPVHYNLHGSAFWEVHPTDDYTQPNNLWISLSPYPVIESSYSEIPVLQIDKGKSVVASNIITGYQKTQKSFISPFRQMQAAFDKDCVVADELFVIGYSFGDYHINSSIVSALRHNFKLKLHFIDPAYSEKDRKGGYELLVSRMIHTLPGIIPNNFNPQEMPPVYSADKNSCSYFKGKLTVTSVGFSQYLSEFKL